MKIIKPVFGGYGLGFENSRTHFIEKAVPGDDVIPFIYKKRKKVLYGRIERMIESSPARINPACPCFEQCAGCSYQMLSYEDELKLKRTVFEETVSKLSGIPCSVSDFIRSETRFNYRNKIETSILTDRSGNLSIGFHRRDDWRRVIDIENCMLANNSLQEFYRYIRQFFKDNREIIPQEFTHFTMRSNRKGEILLVLWFDNLKTPCSFLDSLNDVQYEKLRGIKAYNIVSSHKSDTSTIQIYMRGDLIIEDKYRNYSFAMSPESFFQVNPYITDRITEKLLAVIRKEEPGEVFDLFAGNGFWGIMASGHVRNITGVEISELSEKEFYYNQKANNINNYTFIKTDVRPFLKESALMPDMIVLDPPRAGISPRIITRIRDRGASVIVYISCNPSTLARDLSELSAGYSVKDIMLYDMFPNTYHVECVVVLKKNT